MGYKHVRGHIELLEHHVVGGRHLEAALHELHHVGALEEQRHEHVAVLVECHRAYRAHKAEQPCDDCDYAV